MKGEEEATQGDIAGGWWVPRGLTVGEGEAALRKMLRGQWPGEAPYGPHTATPA